MPKLKRLSNRDLEILQSALSDLYADVSQATLPERTLRFAKKIIPAHIVAFNFWDANGNFKEQKWDDAPIQPNAEQWAAFTRYVHENPVYIEVVVKKRTDPVILTDFITTEEFIKTNVYREFYSFVEDKYQMAITLWISSDLIMTCIFCHNLKNYSERDRLMLSTAAPHLINAVRNASDFDYLASALEVRNSGVMSVEGGGKIHFVSEFVRQIWNKYFERETVEAAVLPACLSDWIKSNNLFEKTNDAAVQPFRIKNTHGELSVRPISNSQTLEKTFLFEEKRIISPKSLESLPLTRREAEVLFWLAQGKSDRDISLLCEISPHTVHKHAQNIYVKLGVETRTAAVMKALEIL